MLALGGPADDVEETRFSAETLAEGCASGMRWAATRMQGHRPHQVCAALLNMQSLFFFSHIRVKNARVTIFLVSRRFGNCVWTLCIIDTSLSSCVVSSHNISFSRMIVASTSSWCFNKLKLLHA